MTILVYWMVDLAVGAVFDVFLITGNWTIHSRDNKLQNGKAEPKLSDECCNCDALMI